jgi:hypothetical protein
MKIEAEIFRISEKTQEQDEFVMIRKHGEEYWAPKVYNAHYNCWDTEDVMIMTVMLMKTMFG